MKECKKHLSFSNTIHPYCAGTPNDPLCATSPFFFGDLDLCGNLKTLSESVVRSSTVECLCPVPGEHLPLCTNRVYVPDPQQRSNPPIEHFFTGYGPSTSGTSDIETNRLGKTPKPVRDANASTSREDSPP